ncbi:MAG: tRNA (adenosine(37)-N6)-threonylcarbamoyltransferase complex transferase subunit TsaD [Candidatus Nomurabacteria bacterium]|jgi:N6-L-threonylcarbamoyladenine synthase|nr:tRNA (adenosine(37)-N6)-threonylcarbamoyltransferase complex transferase subunit TsaD [Candidatus Nomurabacteria bacterium]
MRVLGIETSCDETAAAVVEDGVRLLSNVVNSQIDIHARYGGVVPEVAARSHIEVINPVIDEAVQQAGGWGKIDAIAVTYAPGLIGSLMVGTLAARTLAITKNKPLYPIHHIESHIYANWLRDTEPSKSANPSAKGTMSGVTTPTANKGNLQNPYSEPFPPAKTKMYIPDDTDRFAQRAVLSDGQCMTFLDETGAGGEAVLRFPVLALVVSGGHTQLILLRNHGDFDIIGTTRDDAVGEVFDKVAKIIGLPYPGGPSISKAALKGDRLKYKLPKAKLDTPYDFSFSGLKTAVLRAVQAEVGKDFTFPSAQLPELLNDAQRADFAASFEKTAVDTLVDKLLKAYDEYQPKAVMIAGGVSANQYLREQIQKRLPIQINFPPIEFCTDNGAMVASAGYFHAQRLEPSDPYDLEITPQLKLV